MKSWVQQRNWLNESSKHERKCMKTLKVIERQTFFSQINGIWAPGLCLGYKMFTDNAYSLQKFWHKS